jgi:hypothetical protein
MFLHRVHRNFNGTEPAKTSSLIACCFVCGRDGFLFSAVKKKLSEKRNLSRPQTKQQAIREDRLLQNEIYKNLLIYQFRQPVVSVST